MGGVSSFKAHIYSYREADVFLLVFSGVLSDIGL